MINFRVIRISDLVKVLIKVVIIVVIVISLFRAFNFVKNINFKDFIKSKFEGLDNRTFLQCIDENIGKTSDIKEQKSIYENIIGKELKFLGLLSMNEKVIDTVNQGKNDEEKVQDLRNVKTEVVAEHNKNDTFTNSYGSVQVKNGTSFNLTQEMLTPDISFNNKKDIVIFHTHTCESYTASEKYNYTQTGNFRTTDLNYSVASVGGELTDLLTKKGFNIVHDTTYHDYPEYSGSYTNSLKTVEGIISQTPAELVIDLHRDALADSTYAPKVKIGDEYAAQLMFVMGSSEGGLYHPNWNENLKLAIKIQEKANEMYPGLFKPIMLTKYRYNQSAARCACIIEVGATGNTLDEAKNSMKYLAEVIDEVMKE